MYYGAGASEAALTKGEDVYIVGGGNSAGQAAMHFARFAKRIFIVIRGESLKETLSQYLLDRLRSTPNIEVLPHTEVIALHGDRGLEEITLADRDTGQKRSAKTRWLFVCVGGVPQTDWADEVGVVRDEGGYLQLAARPRSVLPGDQRLRHIRRRRCAPRLGEAGCFRGGRGRHGGRVGAPLPRERLGSPLCQLKLSLQFVIAARILALQEHQVLETWGGFGSLTHRRNPQPWN